MLDTILASIKKLKMAKVLNKQLINKIDGYRTLMKQMLFKMMMPNESKDTYSGLTLN